MKCPVGNCGANIIFVKIDGDLIPYETDRIHTLNPQNLSILHLDKDTVPLGEVNHWKSCRGYVRGEE